MSDERCSEDIDISRFVEEHCNRAAPDDNFRRVALGRTRRIVAGRGRRYLPALRLVSAVGVLALMVFLAINLGGKFRDNMVPQGLLAVTSIHGRVTLASGQTLELGDRVTAGSVVHTSKDARVTLVTRKGSLFHLDSNSILTVSAEGSAEVSRGRLYCRSRMHEIGSITAPGGQVRLLGTVVNAEILKPDTTAVTVVEGRVELRNEHGESVVDQGRRALLAGSEAPDTGVPTNTIAETAWYDGRNRIVSDSGQIIYTVQRAPKAHCENPEWVEVWAMNADGSGKHRIASYAGKFTTKLVSWWMGAPWAVMVDQSATRHPIDGKSGGWPCKTHLLNVATGEDVLLGIPQDYTFYAFFDEMALSPDCRRLAFAARRKPDTDFHHRENGIWVYDLLTGEIRKVFDHWFYQVSWSPDGRYLVGSFHNDVTQAVINLETGEARWMSGEEGTVSPDGTKLAYHWGPKADYGMLTPGSVFVLDVTSDAKAIRISPQDEGGHKPCWSPDGTRILYDRQTFHDDQGDNEARSFGLLVANADGSGVTRIYTGKGFIEGKSWSPDGETVYARIVVQEPQFVDKVLAIAADGSGEARDLGGNEEDSILTPEESRQTEQAMEALGRARAWYQMGEERVFEGRPQDARKCFKQAAVLMYEAPWRYPLAGLSTTDLGIWADDAYRAASLSDGRLLEIGCRRRMDSLRGRLRGKFPPALPEYTRKGYFEGWQGGCRPMVDPWDGEPVHIYTCPGPHPARFLYRQPTTQSRIGDIIIRCPNHPMNCLKLEDAQLKRIRHDSAGR